MSSLEETPGPEMGVSDKGDIQNVQCCGAPRTRVEKHCYRVIHTTIEGGPSFWMNQQLTLVTGFLAEISQAALLYSNLVEFIEVLQVYNAFMH